MLKCHTLCPNFTELPIYMYMWFKNLAWQHGSGEWIKKKYFHEGKNTILLYSDKRKQLTNHPNLTKWCFYSTSHK